MSVGIHFEHIVKKYGENVIIPDLNLDVREGEFFTLLGPSGCGKTTLLRMVAGFNSIEGGTIRLQRQGHQRYRHRTSATSAWFSRITRSSRT